MYIVVNPRVSLSFVFFSLTVNMISQFYNGTQWLEEGERGGGVLKLYMTSVSNTSLSLLSGETINGHLWFMFQKKFSAFWQVNEKENSNWTFRRHKKLMDVSRGEMKNTKTFLLTWKNNVNATHW